MGQLSRFYSDKMKSITISIACNERQLHEKKKKNSCIMHKFIFYSDR